MRLPVAVVFDMDGTLLDSERLARACFVDACRDVGWDANMMVYDRCVGTTYVATERIMREGYGADFPYEQMSERWSHHYQAAILAEPVPVKPGVLPLLERLSDAGIPMAIATSTQRPTVEIKLGGARLRRYFSHLVCGGEAANGKPSPDPYLLAAQLLEAAPEACWAVEDSDNGVRSAHAAGFRVFQIPDELTPSAEVRAMGHPILDRVDQLLNLI